ncbi:MAG: 50S ribosomal protein L21 [Clostridia bacterium]
MYAIIENGGKQYRVSEGDVVSMEKIVAEIGSTIFAEKVLMVVNGENVKVGSPIVEAAKVTLKIVEHGKGKKVVIFKFKAKKNYRRKQGHRQPYTKVMIDKIEG